MRINRLSSLFAAAIMLSVSSSYRMADDAPAADTPAPTPVTVEVPAEHADIVERVVELLKKGEQFVVDNIHAGLSALEGLFADKGEDPAPANDTDVTERVSDAGPPCSSCG